MLLLHRQGNLIVSHLSIEELDDTSKNRLSASKFSRYTSTPFYAPHFFFLFDKPIIVTGNSCINANYRVVKYLKNPTVQSLKQTDFYMLLLLYIL